MSGPQPGEDLRLAPAPAFETVKAFYQQVIDGTPDIARDARWVYGKHPTDQLLQGFLDRGELYSLTRGGEAAGMAAIVMAQGEDYHGVAWGETLADDQVATLHLLAIHPGCRGRGVGLRMLEEALRLAAARGKRAFRLDVLRSNLPARRLYEKAGFTLRGSQVMYAENTGWAEFLFYDKALTEPEEKEGEPCGK